MNSVRDGLNKVVLFIEKSCKDMVTEIEKEEQNKRFLNNDENYQSNFVLSPNYMNKINENQIAKFIGQLLQKDEYFKLYYQDLNEEIQKLQIDFKKEVYFNHGQISQLKPPSKNIQPLQSVRYDTVQHDNEDFNSFLSFSEEEKKNDLQQDYKDQQYQSQQKKKNQQNQSYGYGSASQLDNESLQQSQSQIVYQDSVQLDKSENVRRVNKKELLEHEEFIKKRISWSQNEELRHHFSCAFAQNINLQGRIYITNLRLIFQSYFNGNNLFFNETILEIPRNDILQIHKKKNMLLFDNAIQVDVVKGSLLFTQFIYRDDAYNAILNVLQPANMVSQPSSQRVLQKQEEKKNNLIVQEGQKSLTSILEENFDQQSSNKYQQQVNQRRQNIDSLMKQSANFKYELSNQILKGENITIRDIYQACLGDSSYTHKSTNKEYQNFFFYYIENIMKSWNISIEKWSPPPPKYFLDSSSSDEQAKKKEKIQDWIEISQREVNYEKAIPLSGVPFLPKSCKVSEKQKLIFISPDELVFELEAYSSGAPMSDSFYHIIRNTFVQLTPDSVSYRIQMDVRFLKSNWLSGTIESQSQKEGVKSSEENMKCYQERMTEFLKIKNEKRRKSVLQLNGHGESDNKSVYSNNRKQQSNHSQDFKKELNNRQQSILSSIEPQDKYKQELLDIQFNDSINGLKVSEVFRVIFDDSQPFEGFSDLYECLKIKKFNDKNYSATKFSPKIPQFIYSDSDKKQSKQNPSEIAQTILGSPHFSEREIKYVHPLPASSIPFMPKECQVREVMKAYWISDSMIIINIEGFTSGIPKGDSFSVRLRYILTQKDPNSVQLKYVSYVNFLQSTFLQGQIESNTVQQQQIASQVIKSFYQDAVQNYLTKKQSMNKSNNLALSRSSSIQKKQGHEGKSTPETKAAIENRKRRILSTIESNDKFKHTLIDHTFNYQNKPISLHQVFNLFFNDNQSYKGHQDFYEYLKKGCIGDIEYSSNKFSPPIPNYFTDKGNKSDEELLSSPDYSERQLNFTHPLPESNIPFMPKTCKVKEIIKVYWVSNDMIVINVEAFTSGIPKGDSFSVRVRFIFKQIDEQNIHLMKSTYIHFIQSTFLSGKIESNTIEQQKLTIQNHYLPNFTDAFNKYMLEKSKHSQKTQVESSGKRQKQYDTQRIRSIHVMDDVIDSNSYTDFGDIGSQQRQTSNRMSNKQQSPRNRHSKQNDQQNEQIQKLNQNIDMMNDRIKYLITGFVIVYISTLVFMYLNK